MPVAHYENFPVASWLLPRRLRRPLEAIYWFARSADDIADEGTACANARIAALRRYADALDAIESGRMPDDSEWRELAVMIAEWKLPVSAFRDLLSAFEQDVTTTRYATFADVLDYCRRSANPVGRLVLHLFGCAERAAIERSDAICTGLQLLNFCQDVGADFRRGRIYFPQDEMRAMNVGEAHIADARLDDDWRRLYAMQLERALRFIAQGAPLAERFHGRMRLELRAIVAGGERIGRLLASTGGDVFARRPVLDRGDWIAIGWRALLGRANAARVAALNPSA